VEAEAEAWADHIMSLRDADEAATMAQEVQSFYLTERIYL
jgi:hypothetical protein